MHYAQHERFRALMNWTALTGAQKQTSTPWRQHPAGPGIKGIDKLSGTLTAVLQAVEEGAVHARIEGAIAHERGRQLLWVPRHYHTLRAPHLRHSSCVWCHPCPEK